MSSFFRTFECINDQCQRTNKPISIVDPSELKLKGHHTTLAACRLVCGSLGGLWPIPTGPITIGKNVRYIIIIIVIFFFNFNNNLL